jgi:hypothetical protein
MNKKDKKKKTKVFLLLFSNFMNEETKTLRDLSDECEAMCPISGREEHVSGPLKCHKAPEPDSSTIPEQHTQL